MVTRLHAGGAVPPAALHTVCPGQQVLHPLVDRPVVLNRQTQWLGQREGRLRHVGRPASDAWRGLERRAPTTNPFHPVVFEEDRAQHAVRTQARGDALELGRQALARLICRAASRGSVPPADAPRRRPARGPSPVPAARPLARCSARSRIRCSASRVAWAVHTVISPLSPAALERMASWHQRSVKAVTPSAVPEATRPSAAPSARASHGKFRPTAPRHARRNTSRTPDRGC